MKAVPYLDRRSIIVAIAGPNGAGKTTFYHSQLERTGLRFVNADVLALDLDLPPYAASNVAEAIRQELVRRGESFVFETVFSDPTLNEAAGRGYTVVLCFIGLDSPELSEERVAMRVSQGGHDVPRMKLRARYPRTLVNLRASIRKLQHVLVYDNSDLRTPFRKIAEFESGRGIDQARKVPRWFRPSDLRP